LKKVGFQKKNGAKPHLVKIENNKTYQITPSSKIESVDDVCVTKKKICSKRYQSKEKSLV
jgi:hypothetical protein